MALTAAERAKRYRDKKKLDPETYRNYLEKERNRYHERRARGDFNIGNLSERAQMYQRRKWKLKQRKRREKKKMEQLGTNFMNINSPAASPPGRNEHRDHAFEERVDENPENPPPELQEIAKSPRTPERSHQNESGKKRKNRNKAKSYRKFKKVEKDRDYYKALWEAVRKSNQRLKKKLDKKELGTKIKSSDEKHKNEKSKACQCIEPKLSESKKSTTKQPKNQLVHIARRVYQRTGRSISWNIDMRRRVKHFLEEDLSSTQAPGKKDTITRNKKKMQKRYLNDTLLNLYKLFKEKNPEVQLSYVSFCRFRPFWIVQKRIDARETCLCKLHENMKFRIEKLHRLKIVNESNPDKLAADVVCEGMLQECSYGTCKKCKDTKIKTTSDYSEENAGTQVTYMQWVSRSEQIQTRDGQKTVLRTQKVEQQETIETLLNETTSMLKEKYIRHVFNIKHQYRTLKDIKDDLKDTEAILNIDFSENYNGKLAEEIQTMHFGGNRRQISLHTVVVYTQKKVESFCTVSDNTQHGPGAILAHMRPVITALKEDHPKISTLHFVSDGPSTQYKNKNNFFMFHQEIIDNFSFEKASWNFTESGHGKSSADGVGGTVKRTADRIVANGNDINDAMSFFEKVRGELKSIRIFLIDSNDIEKVTESIPASLETVKGTMKLHQVVINAEHRGLLRLKLLSCFCKWPNPCSCFIGDMAEHSLNLTKISESKIDKPAAVVEDSHTPTECSVRPHPDLVGTWVAVYYQGEAYPGIIQDIDEQSAEVKCMARIGLNRFFWPRLEDIIWYDWNDIVKSIREPEQVTSRHVQIHAEEWKSVLKAVDERV